MRPSKPPEDRPHSHAPSSLAVRATSTRVGSHPEFAGRGVTIAFLDSGFQRHPDLTAPRDRVLALAGPDGRGAIREEPAAAGAPPPGPWQWHGTQTSVVAAGNGGLSDGLYRGLAHEADVVLVRMGDRGRIGDGDIARAVEWVVENRARYDIRVLNISAGGDEAIPYAESVADQAAELAVREGIVVVAAAGNAGFERNHLPMPPANAPSVITVGGYDDKDQSDADAFELYRSSFGPTVDGLLKPELVAPAASVAAPILLGSPLERRAHALCALEKAADGELAGLLRATAADAGLDAALAGRPAAEVRAAILAGLREDKIVAPHYQHVDGTSFAAPIVASVVAQMLEANPDLRPHAVKHILLSTADRLSGASLMRQGFGVLDAGQAVRHARRAPGGMPDAYFRPPHRAGGAMVFHYIDAEAKRVALAGDFNGWRPDAVPFERLPNGVWRAEAALPREGACRYKFVVDGERWVEDPNNWLKAEDGLGGLASVLYLGS